MCWPCHQPQGVPDIRLLVVAVDEAGDGLEDLVDITTEPGDACECFLQLVLRELEKELFKGPIPKYHLLTPLDQLPHRCDYVHRSTFFLLDNCLFSDLPIWCIFIFKRFYYVLICAAGSFFNDPALLPNLVIFPSILCFPECFLSFHHLFEEEIDVPDHPLRVDRPLPSQTCLRESFLPQFLSLQKISNGVLKFLIVWECSCKQLQCFLIWVLGRVRHD